MARPPRITAADLLYHVINRRAGRLRLFDDELDYAAFEKVMGQACARVPMRVLAFCLMPNHWHLVLWPRRDGDLSRFMQWLTVTHMRRWHAHRNSAGTGPLYQGRFKSFLIQRDTHLLAVLRYVEGNALRAGLVASAADWKWSSVSGRTGQLEWLMPIGTWPIDAGPRWVEQLDEPQSQPEMEALRRSVVRGSPFGSPTWGRRTAIRLGLESSLRNPGRPPLAGKKDAGGRKNVKPLAMRKKSE